MNIINTLAPIPITELKKYFEDKNTFYVINYQDSTLKGSKLLTYLSNLDLPCDIQIDKDSDEFMELVVNYLHHPLITHIPVLEEAVINLMLESKGLEEHGYATLINENKEIVNKWSSVLDSLSLYNLYTVASDELKEFISLFPVSEISTTEGINFVSILKHERFFNFYSKVDKTSLLVYKHYFDQNMFKGKNLYAYWANENNPLFLITYGIASGNLDVAEYNQAKKNTLGAFENVSLV